MNAAPVVNRAYGYIRASTSRQALTLPVQQDKIQKYFAGADRCEGAEFAGYFHDRATSSKIPLSQRKQGREMLLRLKPGDHIIITSVDRAFRSLAEAIGQFEHWWKDGVKVHVLDSVVDTSTTLGRLILQLLAWVAEFERAMIRDRTAGIMGSPAMKQKQKDRVKNGKLGYGSAPLGFVHKGAPGRRYRVEDPAERAVMAKIVAMRDEHRMTWHEIRKSLMMQKIVTRDGRWWVMSRIQRAYAAELKLREGRNVA
jgi:DNA invertase Pin-like site-specific DNA recombinase